MKPHAWTFVAALSLSLLAAACIPQRTPPQNLDKVTVDGRPIIRVGVDETFIPFTQPGADGKTPVGFEIDLMKDIAAKSGMEVTFVPSNHNQILAFVSQCQLDAGLSGVPISDPLAASMSFSDPYYTTGQVVLVKQGNLLIQGKDDLSGMKVGTQDGTPSEAELEQISGVDIRDYGTYELAVEDLINGYIDAVVIDYPRALAYLAVARNNLKIAGDEFGRVEYGIAVCAERADLLEPFNAALADATGSGRLDRLVKKWGIQERPAAR